jgi:hypothetical protein
VPFCGSIVHFSGHRSNRISRNRLFAPKFRLGQVYWPLKRDRSPKKTYNSGVFLFFPTLTRWYGRYLTQFKPRNCLSPHPGGSRAGILATSRTPEVQLPAVWGPSRTLSHLCAVTGRENTTEKRLFSVYLLRSVLSSDIGYHTWGGRGVGVWRGEGPGAPLRHVRIRGPGWSGFSINFDHRAHAVPVSVVGFGGTTDVYYDVLWVF